jgi:ABC-type sugar transport system ATPase subunit
VLHPSGRGVERGSKQEAEQSMTPFLEMTKISKTFVSVKALRGVDLTIFPGEVHAVAGENGAGKSTLMKIMTGVLRADPGGSIRVNGEIVDIADPLHARSLGISIIYQELSMVENLTVAENIFLAREPLSSSGLIDSRAMNKAAREALDQLHLSLAPTTPVSALSIGHRQMIEIAKAISVNARVIIMDEPTSSLGQHETTTLLNLIRTLKERGIGIVYISHRLDEIFEIADRVTVLRDGATVASMPIADMTRELLVQKMVDRDLHDFYGEHQSFKQPARVLSVRNLEMRHPDPHRVKVSEIDFDLYKGEVLGFFGLVGAGRTEIMEMIFGMRPYAGEILVRDRPVAIRDPADAIRFGMGFVTEDRQSQGLALGMTIRENFSLTHLASYCWFGLIDIGRERARCADFVKSLGIRASSTEQQAINLSGGNQQKVVIAKWMARALQILIVDEPTRGIDVRSKAEVHGLLAGLASEGLGVIVISSDLPEVLAVSDRILVVKNGRIGGELSRSEATKERVMELAAG